MRIEFTAEEVTRLASSPLPWFSDTVREALGKTPLTTPEADLDLGILYYDSDQVDEVDVWFVDMLRAGWAYVDSDPANSDLEVYQTAQDWQLWDSVSELSTKADTIIQHFVTLSTSLNVSIPSSISGI